MLSNNTGMLSGETLRLFRTLKGIKQETVAKDLGISQPAYCKLEHCTCIQGKKLEQLLKILNCTKEDIEVFNKFLPPQTEP